MLWQEKESYLKCDLSFKKGREVENKSCFDSSTNIRYVKKYRQYIK